MTEPAPPPRTRRRVPERPLRVLALVLACAPPPLVLSGLDTDLGHWQQPLPWVFALLIATLCLVRGEQNPALMDEDPARRAARYSLLVPPALFLLALLFPYTISWAALWGLAGVELYLLAYAYVPRVRTAALGVASALALGLTVLEPGAGVLLAAPALCWLALPALDQSARARLSLYADTPAALRWPLWAVLASFVCGGVVFAAVFALLPPTALDYRGVGLLQATGRLEPRGSGEWSPPWLELTILVVLVVATLVLIGRGLSGRSSGEEALEEPEHDLGWSALGSAPRPARGQSAWPADPRRALVERYLDHLERLRASGLSLGPEDTPAQIAARLPAELQAEASRLAERFQAARWTAAPVSAEDLAEVERATDKLEAALAASAPRSV